MSQRGYQDKVKHLTLYCCLCGHEFDMKQASQRFCSSEHRQEFHKKIRIEAVAKLEETHEPETTVVRAGEILLQDDEDDIEIFEVKAP